MEDKIKSLIEKFYDDPEAVSKNFGGPENFIRFILSKGGEYANLLDPKNEFFYDEGLQDLLIWEQYQASDNKPEFLREFVMEFLSNDLSVEGDKIFWVGDKDDLLFAFDDRGRDATARDIAKTVFNDDFYSWYDFRVFQGFQGFQGILGAFLGPFSGVFRVFQSALKIPDA